MGSSTAVAIGCRREAQVPPSCTGNRDCRSVHFSVCVAWKASCRAHPVVTGTEWMVDIRVAKPPKELLDLLKPYDSGIQELTLALRQLVLEEMAPCCEYIVEVYIVSI